MRTEVAIVGAGPAGLSAALVLGRCRRRVVVFDSGSYRNARSHALHGFLSRDGISPDEFRRLACAEIARYETVEMRHARVTDVLREDESSFIVECQDGSRLAVNKVLLATGLRDELPALPGAAELFGDGVYSCPYCDGWEFRDQPLAAYDRQGRYAVALAQWSRDVVICSDGPAAFEPEARRQVEALGLTVDERSVARFERAGEHVLVCFRSGAALRRRALFVHAGCRPQSDLPVRLGCRLDEHGGVWVDRRAATSVSGVYVAGDASRDALQAVVAAGEGAAAAMAINSALTWLKPP